MNNKRIPPDTKYRRRRAEGKPVKEYASFLPEFFNMMSELTPFSTACDKVGIAEEKMRTFVGRFPAIREEIKRRQADKKIRLQKEVEAGGPGWQAKMRILESADPDNWMRTSGKPGPTRAAYSSALASARKAVGRKKPGK